MVIRKMKIEDYDNVYDLWMSCVGMGLNNLDDSKEGIDKFIQRNPDTCLVAEKDSQIIGVIMVGNDEDVVIYIIRRFALIIEGWELRANWLIRQ